MGTADREKTAPRGGIRRKIISIILMSVFSVIFMGVSVVYFLSWNLIDDVIRKDRARICRVLAAGIAETIDREVEEIKLYGLLASVRQAVEAANSNRQGLSGLSPVEAAAAFKKVSETAADTLQYIDANQSIIKGIIITDMSGALVASSGEICCPLGAEEEWWRRTFNGGAGGIFMGSVKNSNESGARLIYLAVPVKGEGDRVIGVCNVTLDSDVLFSEIKKFRIEKTGRAMLVDFEGSVFYPYGANYDKVIAVYEKDLKGLIESGRRQAFIYKGPSGSERGTFLTFSEVRSGALSGSGMRWLVLIAQKKDEIFLPLDKLILQLGMVTIILVILAIPIGYFFGGLFANPIMKLREATRKVAEGDWDQEINIRTGDEIEQFAESFKEMIVNVKGKKEELENAKDELEKLSKDLERKVEERTKELSMSQKATLNILEDLKASKEELAREAKALELALQTKSAFTSAVSHELRTPLAAIKEGIAIVLDGTSGTLHEHQKEFLELAKRNVDRLNRLINDILDFQKLESGRMVFKIEPNDINSLIREVALTMEPLLRQKGLDFSLNLLADLPKIRFDHDRIFQVMANLMSNSLKMTEKGSITVSTAAAGNTVRVSVKDTGCGIREDDIPRLFRQFEQLEGGSERRTGGTGLGLAISKQIVEAHKGKIWAESKYGEWTTFSFILPITERRR